MKIVFITTIYLPHIGGIEIYIHEITQYLIKQGHKVCIIVADKTCKEIKKEIVEKECIIRIPAREIGGFFLLKNKRNLKLVRKKIKNADVVHINASKFLFDFFAKEKQKYNYKLVVSSHGWLYHTQKYKFIKDYYFKNIIVKYAPFYDEIINVSQRDQNIAKGFGIQNSCIIESGVDIYKYSDLSIKDKYEGKFVYWGRIARNKGIHICLKKLSEYKENYVFDIIGSCEDKAYENQLFKYIADNNMQNNVNFLGRLSDDEIKEYLERADFILMPSLYEGFGMALVEGLLSRRPIIANTNNAFITILKSVGAEDYLFDYEDENTVLGDKVEELLNKHIEPQNVEQYSIENMIKKTMLVYGI